jgi:TolA-binding protein
VKDYRMLLNEYAGATSPRFPSDPPPAYERLDEVRYLLARELDRGGDVAKAAALYRELLRVEPASRYAARAQLALGEAALKNAASDDFALASAEEAYRRAFEGAKEATVRAAALLRLAQVDERRGERERARERYAQLSADFPASTAAALVPGWAK